MIFFTDETKKLMRRETEVISDTASVSVPTRMGEYRAVPIVKKGEAVLKYQKIAEGGITLHAPISGIAEEVSEEYIVIRSDGSSSAAPLSPVQKSIKELESAEIAAVARDAGIWCCQNKMPLCDVIESCIGRAARMVINLMECQAPVSSMTRLALENTDALIGGIKILMKACGVRHAVIAADASSRGLLRALGKVCAATPLLSVKAIKRGYPAENPRHLIYTLHSVEPDASRTLAECGYAVFDGRACVDMYNALIMGAPSVTCTVTVGGDCVKNQKNLTVPVGTSAELLAEYCGGIVKEPHKIILGGALDGRAVWQSDTPVNKDTTAVLVLSEDYYRKKETACIRCGRCAASCPMYLMPMKISAAYEKGDMKKCQSYGAQSCIDCGLCSYVCPANIPVAYKISVAKSKMRGESNG